MERNIFLIFGKTGTGKTTLAKKLFSEYKRIIIVDSLAEYQNGIIFYTYEDFRDYILFKTDRENFRYILRFTTDDEIEQMFNLVFDLTDFVLVLEEAEIYISPYTKKSNFLRLVNYGRHREISIIGIARRTSELSLQLRAQVNKIYSFKQTEIQDIEKMEKLGLIGLDKLEKYKFIEHSY